MVNARLEEGQEQRVAGALGGEPLIRRGGRGHRAAGREGALLARGRDADAERGGLAPGVGEAVRHVLVVAGDVGLADDRGLCAQVLHLFPWRAVVGGLGASPGQADDRGRRLGRIGREEPGGAARVGLQVHESGGHRVRRHRAGRKAKRELPGGVRYGGCDKRPRDLLAGLEGLQHLARRPRVEVNDGIAHRRPVGGRRRARRDGHLGLRGGRLSVPGGGGQGCRVGGPGTSTSARPVARMGALLFRNLMDFPGSDAKWIGRAPACGA